MAERERNCFYSQFGCYLLCLSREVQCRTAGRQVNHLEIQERDPEVPTGSDGLHPGFFGCESRGEALRRVCLALAVRPFGGGEDATEKSVAESVDALPDTRDLDEVSSDAKNHSQSCTHGFGRNERIMLDAHPGQLSFNSGVGQPGCGCAPFYCSSVTTRSAAS